MENKIFLMFFAVFISGIFSSEIVYSDDILFREDFDNHTSEMDSGLESILAMGIIQAGGK